MAIPFLLGAAAVAAGLFGAKKMKDASDNNKRAKKLVKKAKKMYEEASDRLENSRYAANSMLEQLGETKVRIMAEDMGDFVKTFSKFKNLKHDPQVAKEGQVSVSEKTLTEYQQESLKATKLVKAGLGSLSAGTLAGIAAYGGTTIMATASTGTAISTLSGAAATKATLAYLGGGTLASGGLGVMGGTAVLGGVVLAPILAVAGSIMSAKSEENLAKAEEVYAEAENSAEKMDGMRMVLDNIYDIAYDYKIFLEKFSDDFKSTILNVNKIYIEEYALCSKTLWNKLKAIFGMEIKVDYAKMDINNRKYLHMAWLMAQTMQKLLTVHLITENGYVNQEAKELLDNSMELKSTTLMLNQGMND